MQVPQNPRIVIFTKLFLVIALFYPLHVHAELTVIDLGVLGGQTSSEAWGINRAGQVTGQSTGEDLEATAIVWNGMLNILAGLEGSRSFGFDINAQGEVAGQAALQPGSLIPSAIVWSPKDGVIQLALAWSQARALNNSGFAVGNSNGRAMRWGFAQGTSLDLGDLGGGSADGFDINEVGQVVGYSTLNAQGDRRAFLWEEGVGMRNLGTLAADQDSEARGINNAGKIVGVSNNRAFLLESPSSDMIDLGTLPGGDFSVAEDINTRGVIVGTSTAAGDDEDEASAVIWIKQKIRDLNDFLPPNSPWTRLQNALAINASGDVVGIGVLHGETHGFIALAVIDVTDMGGTNVTEVRVSASSDDAEERATGAESLTSSDLELGDNQTVGMRFTGVDIPPPGATIVDAYVHSR